MTRPAAVVQRRCATTTQHANGVAPAAGWLFDGPALAELARELEDGEPQEATRIEPRRGRARVKKGRVGVDSTGAPYA